MIPNRRTGRTTRALLRGLEATYFGEVLIIGPHASHMRDQNRRWAHIRRLNFASVDSVLSDQGMLRGRVYHLIIIDDWTDISFKQLRQLNDELQLNMAIVELAA